MIVKMKKISIVLLDSYRVASLKELRKLGVLHVENEAGSSETLDTLLEQKVLLEKALSLLPKKKGADKVPHKIESGDILKSAEEVISLSESRGTLLEDLRRLSLERDSVAVWGDFNPEDIAFLNQKKIIIRFYKTTKDIFEKIKGGFTPFVIKIQASQVYFVTVDKKVEGPEEIVLPEKSAKAFGDDIQSKTEEISRKEGLLFELSSLRENFVSEIAGLDEKIRFEEVRTGIGIEGNLSYLTGFLPENRLNPLRKAASENGWGLVVSEPSVDDDVPTLVKNNRIISIIQPVFDLLGTVPGYRERDISFLFLLFFGLFFAMIIGDAGYGSIFLLLSAAGIMIPVLKKKKIPPAAVLMLVMSVCTIIWGALTGTWFGSEAIARNEYFRWMVIENISSLNPRSALFVKYFCFIVGVIHLLIAHSWNFIRDIRRKPFIRAFAQIGWFSLVCGLYYLVLFIVLDPVKFPMPDVALPMILGGLAFVIIFAQQEGNFFKGILKGLGGLITTFLDGVSAFSDIISYIRLFAVGLASVAIARSFNSMAEGIPIAGAVLILMAGHGLNIAMGLLSVIVHGVRLNMLEFSGHAGMEWTGIPYKPFRIEKKENN